MNNNKYTIRNKQQFYTIMDQMETYDEEVTMLNELFS